MAELVSPCCGAEYSDDNEIFKCEACKDEFIEPEVFYEYDERMKESIAEDREDEKRDLGL
jgi:hypothetical protein